MGDQEQHLRIDIKGADGYTLKCVAFFAPKSWFELDTDTQCDFIIKPVENEFQGVRSVEARLIDVIMV